MPKGNGNDYQKGWEIRNRNRIRKNEEKDCPIWRDIKIADKLTEGQQKELEKWETRYSGGLDFFHQFHLICYRNNCFFRGLQWLDYDFNSDGKLSTIRYLGRTKKTRYRQRATVNYTRMYVNMMRNRITSDLPIPIGIPAKDEIKSEKNANITSKVLKFIGERHKLIKDTIAGCFIPLHGGFATKIFWDDDLMATVEDKDGKQSLEKIGDLVIDKIPYTNLVWEAISPRPSDAKWVIHFLKKPLRDIIEAYPGKESAIRTHITESESESHEGGGEEWMSLYKHVYGLGGNDVSKADDDRLILIKEGFELLKSGKWKVIQYIGNDLILWESELSYCPIKFCDINEEIVFSLPYAPVSDIIPLQELLNAQASRDADHLRLHAFPQKAVKEGSIEKEWTNDPDLVIKWRVEKPDYIRPPDPGQGGYTFITFLERAMQDLFGAHEVSNANVPRAGLSGKSIERLQLMDVVNTSHISMAYREHLKDVYLTALKLLQENVKKNEKRLINIVGKQYSNEALIFTKDILDDSVDIRIEVKSSLPDSKEAKNQFLISLFQMGAFNPQKLPETQKLFEIAGMRGILATDYDKDQIARQQAKEENAMLLSSSELPVARLWQNHYIHKEFHSQCLNSLPSESLIEKGEHIQHVAILVNHIRDHDTLILQDQIMQKQNIIVAEKLAREIALGQPAEGEPSPEGVGVPPPAPESVRVEGEIV